MNKKACHGIMIITIVTIFVFCLHAGVFAMKKDQHCPSYDQSLNGLSTYYQMIPESSDFLIANNGYF